MKHVLGNISFGFFRLRRTQKPPRKSFFTSRMCFLSLSFTVGQRPKPLSGTSLRLVNLLQRRNPTRVGWRERLLDLAGKRFTGAGPAENIKTYTIQLPLSTCYQLLLFLWIIGYLVWISSDCMSFFGIDLQICHGFDRSSLSHSATSPQKSRFDSKISCPALTFPIHTVRFTLTFRW